MTPVAMISAFLCTPTSLRADHLSPYRTDTKAMHPPARRRAAARWRHSGCRSRFGEAVFCGSRLAMNRTNTPPDRRSVLSVASVPAAEYP
jgi:hypothetical protein